MRRRRFQEDQAEISITPMLDIVFILLIFFIVTTSFVSEIGVGVARPSTAPLEARASDDMIAVRVDSSGQIWVNRRMVDLRAVKANVSSQLGPDRQTPVVVIAERDADAGLMIRVIDQARAAGAMRVSIATSASGSP